MQKITQIFISDNNQEMGFQLKTNSEMLKDLFFEYEYNLYNNNSIEELLLENYPQDIINTYRKYKESKWEFELRATNLLDTKSQSQSNVSNISVSTNEYFIQPRFITLRLIYSL